MDGTYTNPSSGEYAAQLHQSGTADAPITITAFAGAHPFVVANGPGGFNIDGSYWIIEGLELIGASRSISIGAAQAASGNTNYYRSVGIVIWRNGGSVPQHITVQGNIIHDFPGGGIQSGHVDWMTIQGNLVYNNAWYGNAAGSGISVYEPDNADTDPGGMRIVIRNNVSHHNQNLIPWRKTGTITDGNGIILDDFLHLQGDRVKYTGNTLVYNNLVYMNGGSGIHAFSSLNATIANNTAYLNNQTPSINEGQVFVYASDTIYVANNIMVAPPGKIADYGNKNTNVEFLYNLYDGGTGPTITGTHDIVNQNPLFVDTGRGDFHLMPGSPAARSGSSEYFYTPDLAGAARDRGAEDRGAY